MRNTSPPPCWPRAASLSCAFAAASSYSTDTPERYLRSPGGTTPSPCRISPSARPWPWWTPKRCSTSPSRRPATARRASSESWKNAASAARPPTPPSFPPFRSEATSASPSAVSMPRRSASWSLIGSWSSSAISWTTALLPPWSRSSTRLPRAKPTGVGCSMRSTAISAPS